MNPTNDHGKSKTLVMGKAYISSCFMNLAIFFEVIMGKADNRRTFKMKRKKAQAAKKARLKAKIAGAKAPAAKTTKK